MLAKLRCNADEVVSNRYYYKHSAVQAVGTDVLLQYTMYKYNSSVIKKL